MWQLLTPQVCRRSVDTTFLGPVSADAFISLPTTVTGWRTWSQKIWRMWYDNCIESTYAPFMPTLVHSQMSTAQFCLITHQWPAWRWAADQTETVEYHSGLVLPVCLQLSWPCAIRLEDCKCTYQIKATVDIFVTKSMQIRLLKLEAMEPGQVRTKWCIFCLYLCVFCVWDTTAS